MHASRTQGVSLYCFDNMVDLCRPGDRVTITGLYRAAPMRANPRQTALFALFRTYIDVVHVEREESRRLFSQAAPGQVGRRRSSFALRAAAAAMAGSRCTRMHAHMCAGNNS